MSENILTRIVADKREHVRQRMEQKPFKKVEGEAMLAPSVRDFHGVLKRAHDTSRLGLIAEIKKASPSAGVIREDFDPVLIAEAYAKAGATCLSVLTDTPYFQGEDIHLKQARAACHLPVLRKDFMIDPYQIAESRALGADCVLLIMACLDDAQAQELARYAGRYGMCILLEVHDQEELARAMTVKPFGPSLIGINNRNLKTLEIDLGVTEKLAPVAPEGRLMVSESGIKTRDDIMRLRGCGVSCFLMGENLLKEQDIGAATRALLG
ncbi:MAG: indole-3-glycerol phosphate synthase TrpC [Proteobacteria bacterium]|nr:indole-3-glycerol phosphate synthase TrpC [Pseudomonadota bacterium]